jgi:hypothetical protein
MSYPMMSVLWIPVWQDPLDLQPVCLLYGRGMLSEDMGVPSNDDSVVTGS